MLEFGKNAASIWWAYGITLGLIAALVIWSVTQSRKVKRDLDMLEAKRRG